MATTGLMDPQQDQQQQGAQQPDNALPGQPVGDEATADDKSTQAGQDGQIQAIDPDLAKAAQEIKQQYKLSWSAKRRQLVQRVLKSFEFLKGNPYSIFQRDSFSYDPVMAVISGKKEADDLELYAHNDNVFQMLALSYIAVASSNQDKTRWLPVDPDEEKDQQFSDRASSMMADIERRNGNAALQKLEALYHWCAGSYFSYTRNIVDKARAGYTNTPIYDMTVAKIPNRYICKGCGNVQPEAHTNPFTQHVCQGCNAPLSPSDWYPEEEYSVPMQVGKEQTPNAMTAINVFCLLNIDGDPDAMELRESPILDLEGELTAAAVRTKYPDQYDKIQPGTYGSGNPEDDASRIARDNVTSPSGRGGGLSMGMDQRGTYSRCWIQPWAYNLLTDKTRADALKKAFPTGLKLVTWGPDLVLEMVEEDMLEHWTWCPVLKGLGLFPFGIGDSSVSVQERINDVANNVHAYMDRVAFPSVLADVDQINVSAMNANPQGGGQVIGVKRVKAPGSGPREPLASALFQPQFHIDPGIYSYGQTLLQLAQLLSGIQPQIFGAGTNKGVETKGGQAQMLDTAMGRLMLFFKEQREEHAFRSKNAVKCMARLVDGQMRIRVPSEIEGEEKNEYVLETEVQGDLDAYPEDDDSFPESYAEVRGRLMELAQNLKNIPFLGELLDDPDNGAIFAKYLLPRGVEVPGTAARIKVKLVLDQLSKAAAVSVPDPTMPGNVIVMPSIKPDPDFDDFSTCVSLATKWGLDNFRLQITQPQGFENVRAYLKLASQYQAQKSMQYNAQLQGAVQGAAPQGGGPPGQQMPQAA